MLYHCVLYVTETGGWVGGWGRHWSTVKQHGFLHYFLFLEQLKLALACVHVYLVVESAVNIVYSHERKVKNSFFLLTIIVLRAALGHEKQKEELRWTYAELLLYWLLY